MITREPVVNGSFYPDDAGAIIQMIDKYISKADKEIPFVEEEVIGAITPHAGYIYSGPIAGYTYAVLSHKEPDVVIILAPSHRYHFYGASVMPEGVYKTPIGSVVIDSHIANRLISSLKMVKYIELADKYEHSLEVQVPLLQRIYKNNFRIIPIITGNLEYEDTKLIGKVLYEIVNSNEKTIILASSDLSHFYSYDAAKMIDMETINLILKKKPNEFFYLLGKRAEACGGIPITILMHYASYFGNYEVELLKYANSGDTAGDRNNVVGYMSAIFYIPSK